MAEDDPRRGLDRVPDIADAPVDWDPATRRFRGDSSPHDAPEGVPSVDGRHVVVPAPPEGGKAVPPPRRGPQVVPPGATEPAAPAGDAAAAPTAGDAAGAPPPRATAGGDGRRWWPPSRRSVLRVGLAALAVLLLATVAGTAWGYRQFDRIERAELGDVLATGNGTNYLIVGSDTREGISPDDPNAGAILGPEAPVGSERSDTIVVLRVDGGGARMLSVPRDLLVTVAETGQRTRINAAFNGGPRRLAATLTDQLGLPVHHYLEVDFVSFRDLVDALGGIVVEFPHPAFDTKSGLDVGTAGAVRLDGDQALAYVRSRSYTERIDGREVQEPTGDLGRVVRQQKFLAAVVAEIGSIRNPFRLVGVTNAMVSGMRIDERLGFFDALRLLVRFRGLDPEPASLPTSDLRLSSGAQVLRLVQPEADQVLAEFGSDGAATG